MPSRTRLRRTVSCRTTLSAASDIGSRDAQFAERAGEPRHVPPLVDEPPSPHLADLIDPVGELVAAVLDMDDRVAMGPVAAVHIGNAGHRIHPQRLELAVERRALHADEFGGARNIAAEAADLGAQIFALEGFAGIAQRHAHQMLAAGALGHRRHHGADILRQHVGGDHRIDVAAGENHQPLHVVAQLPHIAGPVMGLQHRHGVVADAPFRQAGRLGNLLHEMLDQLGHVLAPLGQAAAPGSAPPTAGDRGPRGTGRPRFPLRDCAPSR